MKKLLSLVVAVVAVGVTFAQMATPSAAFTSNPTRFDNKVVLIKDAQIVNEHNHGPQGHMGGAPALPCNPPRGSKELNISFSADPEFKGCFYAQNMMADALERQLQPGVNRLEITFMGNARIGYNVTKTRVLH